MMGRMGRLHSEIDSRGLKRMDIGGLVKKRLRIGGKYSGCKRTGRTREGEEEYQNTE